MSEANSDVENEENDSETKLKSNFKGGAIAVFFRQYCGEFAVGKSSLVLRFLKKDQFDDYRSTITSAFLKHTVNLGDGTTVQFEIWDNAGRERSFIPMCFRNANCVVVVYDITRSASFLSACIWVHELQRQADPPIVIALFGNKLDLAVQRQVTQVEAQEYAQKEGLMWAETSAKTGDGVTDTFTRIAKKWVAEMCVETSAKTGGGVTNLFTRIAQKFYKTASPVSKSGPDLREATREEEEACRLEAKARQSLEEAKRVEAAAHQAKASAEMREAAAQNKEVEVEREEAEAKNREADAQKRETEAQRKEEDLRKREEEVLRKEERATREEKESRRKEEELFRLEEKARQSLEAAKHLEAGAQQAEASAKIREAEAQRKEENIRHRELEARLKEEQARRKEEAAHRKEEDARKREEDVRQREEEARRLEVEARQTLEEAKRLEASARQFGTFAEMSETDSDLENEEAGSEDKCDEIQVNF